MYLKCIYEVEHGSLGARVYLPAGNKHLHGEPYRYTIHSIYNLDTKVIETPQTTTTAQRHTRHKPTRPHSYLGQQTQLHTNFQQPPCQKEKATTAMPAPTGTPTAAATMSGRRTMPAALARYVLHRLLLTSPHHNPSPLISFRHLFRPKFLLKLEFSPPLFVACPLTLD